MSAGSNLNKGRVVIGMLIGLAVSLISSRAFAQSDSDPKWDWFVGYLGYQWLHPCGTARAFRTRLPPVPCNRMKL